MTSRYPFITYNLENCGWRARFGLGPRPGESQSGSEAIGHLRLIDKKWRHREIPMPPCRFCLERFLGKRPFIT